MAIEGELPEIEKRVALALGVVLATLGETTSNELNHLYRELHLGSGIFSGKPMTEEMANSTRYEVLPYLMALIIVLVQEWPKRTISCQPILHQFEKAVWSLGLEKAKLTCMFYVDRYYHPRRSDSTSLPREGIIHAEFCQRLAEIWCLSQRSNDARTAKYVQVISNISKQIELNLRGAITGIWP